MDKIKVGIIGYGNLGKGVEKALEYNLDMELVGIFTRRDPSSLDTNSNTYSIDSLMDFKDKIDICILCGGSATDLVVQGPEIAKYFNTIDSYDNHANIPNYYKEIDKIAKENKTTSMISIGWDPGLFSINRLIGESILPKGQTDTFWGKGISQGHSDALRRIDGVKKAIQMTIPNEEVIDRIKSGEYLKLEATEKHIRECFVVLEDGVDELEIKDKIINMPDYFKGYETIVNFLTEEEFEKIDIGMPHGGRVLRLGKTSEENNQVYEFSLDLESNPEFTSSVIVAFTRATYRMNKEGFIGAKTIFDVPLKYISQKSNEELRKNLL